MTRSVLLEAINGIGEHLIMEAAEKLDLFNPHPTAFSANKKKRDNAFSRFVNSAWGIAAICVLVAVSVLGGVIWAGQQAGFRPPWDTTENTEPFSDLNPEEAMQRILDSLTVPSDQKQMKMGVNNDIKMTIDLGGSFSGMTTNYTGYLKQSEKRFDMYVKSSEGEEIRYVYDGEYLYIHDEDKKNRSPMNDGEIGAFLNAMEQDLHLPSVIKERYDVAQLFDTIEFLPEDQSESGTVTIVCTGLHPEAVEDLIPLMRPILALYGVVTAYDVDEQGNLFEDFEAEDEQTRKILKSIAANDLTLRCKVTEEGVLTDMELNATARVYDHDLECDIGYEFKSVMTFDSAEQQVKQPTTAMKNYKIEHWRNIFGHETAESVGLIPDENGVIHIDTKDPVVWNRQWKYIYEHVTEMEAYTYQFDTYTTGIYGFEYAEQQPMWVRPNNSECNYMFILISHEDFERYHEKIEDETRFYRVEATCTLRPDLYFEAKELKIS